MNSLTISSWGLGLALALMTLLFILRIVLTWYPQIELNRGLWVIIAVPTEPFLAPTRKLIPPLGGVDISPILWVGIFSLLREILIGQQGLLTLAMRAH
jgi:YggT family protein